MKLCYLDESGTGNEPYAVMVGVIVDPYRMKITKNDWSHLLKALSIIVKREVLEIHTRDFYPGNSPWRGLTGSDRSKIISVIFGWLAERKHKIVYTAVDKQEFKENFHKETCAGDIDSLWCFMALHICLSIQKHFQKTKSNKGNSMLIFDNEEREESHLINLIRRPPNWTDTYYRRKKGQDRLDQIIDVPYFVDSRHVGLIQVADFVSYFLRRHIEICEGAIPPRYKDEQKLVQRWIKKALKQSIPKSAIYLSKGRCKCADLFHRYAPSCLQ